MSAYEGAEAEAFMEAIRLAPAIAASRFRNQAEDTLLLWQGFMDDCASRGIGEAQAWSIAAAAQSVWVTQLFERQAALEGVCMHRVLEKAVASAQQWALDGA